MPDDPLPPVFPDPLPPASPDPFPPLGLVFGVPAVPVAHCSAPPFLSQSGGKGADLASSFSFGLSPALNVGLLHFEMSTAPAPGMRAICAAPACTRFIGSGE